MGVQKETRHKADRKAAKVLRALERERQRRARREADATVPQTVSSPPVPRPPRSR